MALAHVLSRWALHRSVLILVVVLAGLIASGGASAKTRFPVVATCSGGGQLCNNIATFAVPIPFPGLVGQAQFKPGPLTCSNVRIHFLVDGTEVAATGFVGPGGKTGFVSLGFVGPGAHTVGLQAEGEVGGCNIGTLLSWAGRVILRKAP